MASCPEKLLFSYRFYLCKKRGRAKNRINVMQFQTIAYIYVCSLTIYPFIKKSTVILWQGSLIEQSLAFITFVYWFSFLEMKSGTFLQHVQTEGFFWGASHFAPLSDFGCTLEQPFTYRLTLWTLHAGDFTVRQKIEKIK